MSIRPAKSWVGVFLLLLSANSEASLATATNFILGVHASYPTNLHQALETNSTLRSDYIGAHLELKEVSLSEPHGSILRTNLYVFARALASDSLSVSGKTYLAKNRVYPSRHQTMAMLRERFYRTWKDALPLTPERRNEIADIGGFSDPQRQIFETHAVLIMDNAYLNSAQLAALDAILSGIPPSLHDLGAIGVGYIGGEFPPGMGWWDFFAGVGGEVNIFEWRVDSHPENHFPSDVDPYWTAGFIACAAHEINHIVDSYTITGNASLQSRKEVLIAAAGSEHLNYLRSMFSDGFFTSTPVEFFASIANQWFSSSERTLELGLTRFDAGRIDPINQALFYAEVYSQGNASTWFYASDTNGNVHAHSVPVARDLNGHICEIPLASTTYSFVRNVEGDVVSYTAEERDATAPVVSITNRNRCVEHGTRTVTIGGTCNTNVIGRLTWMTDSGTIGAVSAGPDWHVAGIPLAVGLNRIAITGTNGLGVSTTASVAVVRRSSHWRPGYVYRTRITFPGYDRDEILTNFVALIRFGPNIADFDCGQMVDPFGGSDLRFYDGNDRSELAHEKELWATNEISIVWVQVPQLSGPHSLIWAEWGGNAGGIAQPSYTTNGATWSDEFCGVWHMASDSILDSTHHHMHSVADTTFSASGVAGAGRAFESSTSSGIRLPAGFAHFPDGMSFSVWARPTHANSFARLFDFGNGAASDNICLSRWLQTSGLCLETWQGGVSQGPLIATGAIVLDEWHHYAATVDHEGEAALFRDGRLVKTGTVTPVRNTVRANNFIGQSNWPNDPRYQGFMDEFRVQCTERSSNWVWASYMTMADNENFQHYGQVELPGTVLIIY